MDEHFSEKHRNTEFTNNVTATLRMEPGFSAMLCGSSDDYEGSALARIENRFGRLTMREKTERNGDTNNTELNSVARWIKPGRTKEVAPLIDRDDQMEVSLDLGSPATKEVADAAAAYHDDMVMKAFFGTAYAGIGGETAIPFKATNVLAHGGAGLTFAKLNSLRTLILERNAPLKKMPPIILLQPADEAQLMAMEEYKNADYNGSRPLEDGELKPFMGFRFFGINPDAESLPESYTSFTTDGGATRQCPVIFPKGMHFGKWDLFTGYVDRMPGKGQSMQYWGGSRVAAARTDEDLAFILQNQ